MSPIVRRQSSLGAVGCSAVVEIAVAAPAGQAVLWSRLARNHRVPDGADAAVARRLGGSEPPEKFAHCSYKLLALHYQPDHAAPTRGARLSTALQPLRKSGASRESYNQNQIDKKVSY